MGGACQCQCRKPKDENPLDEILSDKDKNELTNYKNQSVNSNGGFFKSQKPQEIPSQNRFKELGEKNNEINKQTEVDPPIEFNPPPIATTNNFTNDTNNKDNDIMNTNSKKFDIKENEIKEEEDIKEKEYDGKNNNEIKEENNNEIKEENNNEIKEEKLNEIKEENNNEIKEQKLTEIKEENEEKKETEINDEKEQKNINDIDKNSVNSFNVKSEDSNEIKPDDDFSQYIYKYINLIRKNPKSFIPKIKEAKEKVVKDKMNRIIYKSKVKVALSQGEPAFDETISVLEKTEPMEKIEFKPEMTIPLPSTVEEIKDKAYFKNNVKELLKKNIKIKTYWKDNVKDPETSFILMIVDDTGQKRGMKRRDILNPNIKYIGISSIIIDKSFVCYITLSD